MYTIYADEQLLYSPKLSKDGYGIINPKITLEAGKAGSMSFIIPPDNAMYDDIDRLKSIITVYQDNEELFRGRVLHDDKDFYNRKNVYVEGELAFLLDSPVRPYEFKGDIPALFKKFINGHNSSVEEEKQFEIGKITVTDSNNYINRSNSNYSNTFDEIKDKIINTHGGYLRARSENRKRYIDLIEEYENINNQIIEFGVNLLDISQYITAEDVFTCLIPVGAADENTGTRLNIKSVNNNKDYLEDEDAVSLFGRIWKIETWDDVTIASNLLRKGKEFLKNGIEMAVSLTVKAVDLHLINVNTEKIKLGDKIRVISKPHKIDRYFTCTKITLDLVNPDKSVYTLGNSFTTLTEKQSIIEKGTSSAISTANDSRSIAQETSDIVTSKQDKLEAGDNIIIENNVISSMGGCYGLSIDSEKISLVEDGMSDNIPLATEDMIDNIPINGNCINTPMIYSTDEKKVGVWIDGKSIYQKTIHISSFPSGAGLMTIDPQVNNLYEIIDFNGYCAPKDKVTFNTSYTRSLPFVSSPSDGNSIRIDSTYGLIRLFTYSNWSNYEGWLTIRYTKTTD